MWTAVFNVASFYQRVLNAIGINRFYFCTFVEWEIPGIICCMKLAA